MSNIFRRIESLKLSNEIFFKKDLEKFNLYP